MAQTYRLSPGRRAVNRVVRLLIRLGLMPGPTYLLTVPGRRTGRPLSTPVTLVEDAGARWLAIRELSPAEAAPLLQRYVTRVPITRPFFDAKPDSPLAAFEAEAPRHPVFQLGSGLAFRH